MFDLTTSPQQCRLQIKYDKNIIKLHRYVLVQKICILLQSDSQWAWQHHVKGKHSHSFTFPAVEIAMLSSLESVSSWHFVVEGLSESEAASYKMMTSWKTFSASLTLCEGSIGYRWIPCAKKHKCRAFMFSSFLIWPKCWTNSQVAGDLRRHDVHFTWRHCSESPGRSSHSTVRRFIWRIDQTFDIITVLVVNHGISNTVVLEMP